MPDLTRGLILLIGSGEMTAGMSAAHREAMRRLTLPVRAAFLDTPAGFELNADGISARAVEYFQTRLRVEMTVASFKSSAASDAQIQQAVAALSRANYLFAGPGSPTYAIRHWQNSPVLDAMRATLAAGGCLAFASAAALTSGRWAIPVYEIYKVGEAVRWVEGIDLLGQAGLEVAVVPHWNNQSGGDHDTSHCFIGQPRWEMLEAALPPSATVLGIDEHTSCLIQIDQRTAEVRGKGSVTVRRGGSEQVFAPGETFSLDLLRAAPAESAARPAAPDSPALSTAQPAHLQVYEALGLLRTARDTRDWGLMDQAEHALRETLLALIAALPPESAAAPHAEIGWFVDLLIGVRNDLRAARQWALADQIRSALSEHGILIEDGEVETRWRYAGE